MSSPRNNAADAAMTGVMNAMGQDGNYAAARLPIKNRINALDVSCPLYKPSCILI